MTVRAIQIAVTTTGAAGTATGEATSAPIVGQILGLSINYHASAPATSDITVEGATTGLDLYAASNTATDAYVVPGLFGVDAAGAALAGNVTPEKYCVAEPIKVTLAQSDPLTDAVVVTVYYRPCRVEEIAVTTTGSAGSASGTATSGHIVGEIVGVAVNYHPSAPAATTDITVEMATSGIDLYAKSNTATDAFVVPVLYSVDKANAPLALNVTPRHYCVADRVTVTVSQSDPLTNAAIVQVFYLPLSVAKVEVTTTGAAGTATGSASAHVIGTIMGLAVDFHASAPATTGIVVESESTGLDIWARNLSATDAFVVPGLYAVSNAGGALTGDVTPEYYTVSEPVKVTVSGSNALTNAAVVHIFYRR